MINSVLRFVLPPALLLGTLGGALGCAGGVPQQPGAWHSGQRSEVRSSPAAAGPRSLGAAKSRSNLPGIQPTTPLVPPQSGTTASGESAPAVTAAKRMASREAVPNPNKSQPTQQAAEGTKLTLSDAAVPNPLRSRGAQPMPPDYRGKSPPFTVQTVGYQEVLPPVASETIPESTRMMRLANLEEPQPPEAGSASVLVGEPEVAPNSGDAIESETRDDSQTSGLMAEPLPPEDANQQSSGDTFSDQPAAPGNSLPSSKAASQALPGGPAQGHYQQGSPVYGQLLNAPQQPASQRAVQLLDENQRLREELQGQLKLIEGLQARLKQQDELWVRARQEFVEVRSVVDNLTRENLLLKQQIEKGDAEKAELARQYQNLVQTVEQTLDDLLLRAITEPPAGTPPPTQPTNLRGDPPAPAPPVTTGQQASALKSSR